MKNAWLKFLLWVPLVLALLNPAGQATAKDAGSIVADVVVARPLCLVATVLGGAVFVVSLPVAAASGSVDSTAEALVLKPARATFTRPLGDFDSQDFTAKKADSPRIAKQQGKKAAKRD